jgi:hypothetical protein
LLVAPAVSPRDLEGNHMKRKRSMAEFFKVARVECANYTPIGPFGRKDYCIAEPVATDCRCVLTGDAMCEWFIDAILPLHPRLAKVETEGAAVQAGMHDSKLRPCAKCKTRFKAESNRQTFCAQCQKNQTKILARERSRKYRAEKGTASRFSQHEMPEISIC